MSNTRTIVRQYDEFLTNLLKPFILPHYSTLIKIAVIGLDMCNVSLVVEFFTWWVLKSKIFGQESRYSKKFFLMNYSSSKSAKIVPSKSISLVKSVRRPFFIKKFFSKNINIGDCFLVKYFFSKLNF